jgi:hypothetical protein
VRRPIFALLCALAVSACGAAEPSAPVASPSGGRIDAKSTTYAATHGCSLGYSRNVVPPIPDVAARLRPNGIEVEWRFLARPSDCRPAVILVTANSVDKLDNVATRDGATSFMRVDDDHGTVTFRMPVVDAPPYEARVSVYDARSRSTVITTVPVTG